MVPFQYIAVDEADVNENLPINGGHQRKRPGGDMMAALQKGKRKRSETPPPSRRPVGRPNVPPAKPMTIRYTPADSKGVLKDLTGALVKILNQREKILKNRTMFSVNSYENYKKNIVLKKRLQIYTAKVVVVVVVMEVSKRLNKSIHSHLYSLY